jgi:hypothetical protein
MERQAFEPTGLVPRSIIRTFDRFRQQLLPKTKAAAIQEFRISRYQVLVSLKCLTSLLLVPCFINLIAKTFFLTPAIEYLWNLQQNEIFLNSYQEERALFEMEAFSEESYFDSLLEKRSLSEISRDEGGDPSPSSQFDAPEVPPWSLVATSGTRGNWGEPSLKFEGKLRARLQEKALNLAVLYNKESTLAITNLLGDIVTSATIGILFVWMKPQIIILKSFLTESLYSLSDTTKSFLLILGTDLLVGFHSPRGWEIAIEVLLRHFGLPENQDFIFLFVAAFPVFLDTIFKYWIFRYLNKISPSTVATYHNMIE